MYIKEHEGWIRLNSRLLYSINQIRNMTSSSTSQQSSFHYGIVSYDFHTYFKLDDPVQVELAKSFKQTIENEFHNELQSPNLMRVFKTHEKQLGPHPIGYGMFESDTRSPETFLKILNYYQLNHGELSVLIHPRSNQGDLIDHTKNALWLGEKLPLLVEFLISSVS